MSGTTRLCLGQGTPRVHPGSLATRSSSRLAHTQSGGPRIHQRRRTAKGRLLPLGRQLEAPNSLSASNSAGWKKYECTSRTKLVTAFHMIPPQSDPGNPY